MYNNNYNMLYSQVNIKYLYKTIYIYRCSIKQQESLNL